MMRKIFLLIGIPVLLLAGACNSGQGRIPEQPNVLFIICDDLNDFVEGMGGHPQAITPNIKRLAADGVSFTNAHSNDPVCAPCRASLFTGIYPHTSGLYSFENWYKNPTLRASKTIMELFRENGYSVLGTGKLLHHERPELWDEFGNETNYGPYAFNGIISKNNPWSGLMPHPDMPSPFRKAGAVDGSFSPLSNVPVVPPDENVPGYTGWWTGYGPLVYEDPDKRDLMPDEENALWIVEKLKQKEEADPGKPFFMAVGFVKPHTPLYAPQKYFDLFPLEEIQLPVRLENDLEDCAGGLVNNNGYPKGPKYFNWLKESYPTLEEGLRQYLQAYLACVAFADAQVGVVLDALESSSFRDNTIVILTSDHGYHLGEKDQLFKHTLWEESTRIPFIIKVPELTPSGQVCIRPVSLIDIYPTLIDLCNLNGTNMKSESSKPLDGYSLRSLLANPVKGEWSGPDVALSAILSDRVKEGRNIPMNAEDQHFSVRSLDWRYSLANDGTEELYDHRSDPNEWFNLWELPEYEERKSQLKNELLSLTGRQQ